MIGATGFALGAVHAYASAVGAVADAVTFFVSSIFFTSASFAQLIQSQSPAMAATGTARDESGRPCAGAPGCPTTGAGWRQPRSFPARCSSTPPRSGPWLRV